MKENIKFFISKKDYDNYTIINSPFVGYIKDTKEVVYYNGDVAF